MERVNMGKREIRELLLKDLCGRIPYGTKFSFGDYGNVYTLDGIFRGVTDNMEWSYFVNAEGISPIEIEYCKPYLFPTSLSGKEPITIDMLTMFYEKHIDYMGLIVEGMAIDATNKNIY